MHRPRRLISIPQVFFCAILSFLCWSLPAFGQGPEPPARLVDGMEYRTYQQSTPSAGGSKIHVLRIDPSRLRLKLLAASQGDGKLRTASEWCHDFRLLASINAGMFLKDYSTNVGYLRTGAHIQNGRWNRRYASALAFDPANQDRPSALMVDLDEPGSRKKLEGYGAVVQNLRLLKADGQNVWAPSDRKWSEAALAMDRQGKILFFFCQAPMAMWQFNQIIMSLGLDIVRAMHLEGGPLASLSVNTGNLSLDLAGLYEWGGSAENLSGRQMPIPNVIGVAIK